MNKIINEIKRIINQNINEYLTDVNLSDLEENGTIYYMNGKNGTGFDWYVNGHLPSFMVFYNDEKNLGAIKLLVYNNGNVVVYIYGNRGNDIIKEISTSIDVSNDDIFKFAVLLKSEADDNSIWDESIDKIGIDVEINNEKMCEFRDLLNYMEPTVRRKNLLDKMAFLSKKVLDDGFRVGYMYRDDAMNENDSGWTFMAGNEADDYVNDHNNIALVSVHDVYLLDSDIWKYIDNPIGTKLIRISSNEFEVDKNDKEIYVEKR